MQDDCSSLLRAKKFNNEFVVDHFDLPFALSWMQKVCLSSRKHILVTCQLTGSSQVHGFSLLTLPIYPVVDVYMYSIEQSPLVLEKYYKGYVFLDEVRSCKSSLE